MSNLKVPALVFVIGGVLGLVYGSFTYTKVTHESNVGSLKVSYDEKSTVNIPIAVSIGAIVVGTSMLLLARKNA
jgi:uncharacterized membrane protein YidH (DUF202 family)